MLNVIKKIFYIVCLLLITVQADAFDKNKIRIDNSGAHIRDFSTEELQKFYDEMEFPNYLNPDENFYPRVFVKNIPYDYAQFKDKTLRNEMFIKILMPLVLKVNKEYEEERENLLAIEYGFSLEKDFHELDCFYIEKLAKKYEIDTPFKDTRRYIKLLDELILRVDIVPASILVSTAAIYTDWGTSRIAVEGNNLYKAKNWYSDEGLEPQSDDKDYRYKVYDSLEDSIRDYILRVNQNVNYRSFWYARQVARENEQINGQPLYGRRTDWSFVLENNLSNYAGLLDYTVTYYRMAYLDEAQLEDEYDIED